MEGGDGNANAIDAGGPRSPVDNAAAQVAERVARSLSSEMAAVTDDGAPQQPVVDGTRPAEPQPEPQLEATTERDEATDSVADTPLCRASSGIMCKKCAKCRCLHPAGNHTFRTVIERTLSDPDLHAAIGTPARTVSSAEVQLSAEKKKNRVLELERRDAAGQERLVAFDIDPEELSATWDDQKIHGDEKDWQRAHWGHTVDDCIACKGETDLWRICPVTGRTWDSLSPAQRELRQLKVSQLRRVEIGGAPRDGTEIYSDDGDEDDGMRTTSISNLQESKGANGFVRRAVWKKTIKVAIKQNTSQKPNDEEMKLFRDLHHPHIVTCYGILREDRDGKPATSIVTERCTTSLSKFLNDDCNWEQFRKEKLSDDEIGFRKLTILEHVAQGLDRLHDLSVLHRDIKCQNILLDGEPGTCATCGHAGRWKICDFGEATILRTPMLSFHPPKPWCGVVSEGRYQRITSEVLRSHGATHYCWIHPGETFATIAGVQSLPPVYAKELSQLDTPDLKRRAKELFVPQQWVDQAGTEDEDIINMILCPFPDGALVYSFSESEDAVDPNAPDGRDCVFRVRSSSASGEADQKSFPDGLRPFSVVPWTELKADQLERCVSLNLDSCTYTISPESFCGKLPPQLTCLKSLYDSRGGIKGSISAPHEIKQTTSLPVTSSAQLVETRYHAALPQESNGRTLPQDKARWCCHKTGDTLGDGPGKTTSLWLNLSDGFIGGGRKGWDGSGGNGTAVEHYEEMLAQGKHYPLAVKLGTITADGADVYSYAEDEDESVYVPPDRLTELLARWGVDTTRLEKTEQAMQELELEKIKEALWRRRERIPKNATHYVWAYQLEPWEADKNFKHLDTLQQQSGEISLASYGGKIYFTYDGETGEPVVVGINAFTLIDKETARPSFVGGTVERHDDRVSAHVASPELWDGLEIGLETDVYAFGIVMWEVLTRRQAWHWLPRTPFKQFVIQDRVTVGGKRPKIPRGLDTRGFSIGDTTVESVSEMVRKCLHHDPSYRPSVKRLKDWLSKCRARLQQSIDFWKRMQESERNQLRRTPSSDKSQQGEWSVVDRTHPENWNHGRYSEDKFTENPDDANFSLEISNHTRDDWEENALVWDQKDPVPSEPNLEKVPAEPLGIIFDTRLNVSHIVDKEQNIRTLASRYPELTPGCVLKQINGEDVLEWASWRIVAVFPTDGDLGVVFGNDWPIVKHIKRDTMASQIRGLHEGCRLLSINSVSIEDMAFNEAKLLTRTRPCTMVFSPQDPMRAIEVCVPQLFLRPVTLTFSSKPTDATMDVLAPWHVKGMECVGEVAAHEKRRSAEWKFTDASLASQLATANAEIAELKKQLARRKLVPEAEPPPASSSGA